MNNQNGSLEFQEEAPFDFSKYQVVSNEEKPIGEKALTEDVVDEEPFDFNKYQTQKDPGKLEEFGRHTARIASRIGETVLGFPGDVIQMVDWLGSKFPNMPEFLKKDPNFLQKTVSKFAKSLPTSSEIKEKVNELSSGFTEPQNSFEEFGDSVVELASMLTVGKNPTKMKGLASSIGKALTAKGAAKGAEALGAEEPFQLATEMGTLFLTGMFNKKLADKFVSEKYQKAKNLIPEDKLIPTGKLRNKLEILDEELSKGLSTPSKNEVKSAVNELHDKISVGNYPVEELVDSFHDINERMSSKKLFEDLSKTERKKLKFRYDKLKNEVQSEIKNYGKQNPEFIKEWEGANKAFSTIQDSKKITSYLERNLGKLPTKLATSVAIELMLGHPAAAGATVGLASALKTGELLYRVSKNSSLRTHYLNVLKQATAENFPAMVNELNRLDKGLKDSLVTE